MQKVIYQCDICKKEVEYYSKLVQLAIPDRALNGNMVGVKKDVCAECCDKIYKTIYRLQEHCE